MADADRLGFPYSHTPEEEPWKSSPYWLALEELARGDINLFCGLILHGDPIPFTVAGLIVHALKGGDGLPFELKLVTHSSQKNDASRCDTDEKPKPGRRPKTDRALRDLHLAVAMADEIETLESDPKRTTKGVYAAAIENVRKQPGISVGRTSITDAYGRYKAYFQENRAFYEEQRDKYRLLKALRQQSAESLEAVDSSRKRWGKPSPKK